MSGGISSLGGSSGFCCLLDVLNMLGVLSLIGMLSGLIGNFVRRFRLTSSCFRLLSGLLSRFSGMGGCLSRLSLRLGRRLCRRRSVGILRQLFPLL